MPSVHIRKRYEGFTMCMKLDEGKNAIIIRLYRSDLGFGGISYETFIKSIASRSRTAKK